MAFFSSFESEFISHTCTYRQRSGHLTVLQSEYYSKVSTRRAMRSCVAGWLLGWYWLAHVVGVCGLYSPRVGCDSSGPVLRDPSNKKFLASHPAGSQVVRGLTQTRVSSRNRRRPRRRMGWSKTFLSESSGPCVDKWRCHSIGGR